MSCEIDGVEISDPTEYQRATFLCEYLLAFQSALPKLRKTKSIRDKPWNTLGGKLIEAILDSIKQDRPILTGEENEQVAAAEVAFSGILNECEGSNFAKVERRVCGAIVECVAVLKTWVASFGEQVEAVTRHPAFFWMEIANTIADTNLPVTGPDGRLLRVQRICSMLDSVIAKIPEHDIGDSDDKEEKMPGDITPLESIPTFDPNSGKWTKNKLAASAEGVETRTLATYRQSGLVADDKGCGIDRYGRMWRRNGNPGSHPWYFRESLKSFEAARKAQNRG